MRSITYTSKGGNKEPNAPLEPPVPSSFSPFSQPRERDEKHLLNKMSEKMLTTQANFDKMNIL